MVVPCIWFEIRVNYQQIINSIAPEDGRIGPKHVELK